MTKMLINGKPGQSLGVKDRATQYGDGVFTTIRVAAGQPEYWSLHLQRLQRGLLRLGIAFTAWTEVEQAVFQMAADNPNGVLKLLISRGEGGRGYQPPDKPDPVWVLSVHPFPDHYRHWQQQGIEVGLSEIQLGRAPQLAGIKHLNRLEQVRVKMQWPEPEPQDVVVCDTQGMMVECSASNIFWRVNGLWYTPDLHYAGVAGVMRQRVIEHLETTGRSVTQVQAPPSVLAQAEAVLICNSLMGIVPVRRFLQYEFALDRVRQLAGRCFE